MCLSNEGTPASLEVRKICATVPDAPALKQGLLRVVDETGEDYLYPSDRFVPLKLPPKVARAIGSTLHRAGKG